MIKEILEQLAPLDAQIAALKGSGNEMDAIIEVEEARKSLCSYLGLPTTQETEVVIEDSLPHFEIPVDKAYELAVAASPDVDGVKLSLLSSESNLADVRADARLKDVPIIMITSRMADKHRNYAMEIGVNHYLGKPYQEEQLLELITGFIAAQRS